MDDCEQISITKYPILLLKCEYYAAFVLHACFRDQVKATLYVENSCFIRIVENLLGQIFHFFAEGGPSDEGQ